VNMFRTTGLLFVLAVMGFAETRVVWCVPAVSRFQAPR